MTQPVHVKVDLVMSTSKVWPGHRGQCPALEERPCHVSRSSGFIVLDQKVTQHGSCCRSLGQPPGTSLLNFLKTLWELMVGKGSVTGQSDWSRLLRKRQTCRLFVGVSGESSSSYAQYLLKANGGFPSFQTSCPLSPKVWVILSQGSHWVWLASTWGALGEYYQVFSCMLPTDCVSFQGPGWRGDSPQGCGRGARLGDSRQQKVWIPSSEFSPLHLQSPPW